MLRVNPLYSLSDSIKDETFDAVEFDALSKELIKKGSNGQRYVVVGWSVETKEGKSTSLLRACPTLPHNAAPEEVNNAIKRYGEGNFIIAKDDNGSRIGSGIVHEKQTNRIVELEPQLKGIAPNTGLSFTVTLGDNNKPALLDWLGHSTKNIRTFSVDKLAACYLEFEVKRHEPRPELNASINQTQGYYISPRGYNISRSVPERYLERLVSSAEKDLGIRCTYSEKNYCIANEKKWNEIKTSEPQKQMQEIKKSLERNLYIISCMMPCHCKQAGNLNAHKFCKAGHTNGLSPSLIQLLSVAKENKIDININTIPPELNVIKNQSTNELDTPFIGACRNGFLRIVEILLDQKPPPDFNKVNKLGKNALECALDSQQFEIVNLLISKNFPIPDKITFRKKIYDSLKQCLRENEFDKIQNASACLSKIDPPIKFNIEEEINKPDSSGQTLFDIDIRNMNLLSALEKVKYGAIPSNNPDTLKFALNILMYKGTSDVFEDFKKLIGKETFDSIIRENAHDLYLEALINKDTHPLHYISEIVPNISEIRNKIFLNSLDSSNYNLETAKKILNHGNDIRFSTLPLSNDMIKKMFPDDVEILMAYLKNTSDEKQSETRRAICKQAIKSQNDLITDYFKEQKPDYLASIKQEQTESIEFKSYLDACMRYLPEYKNIFEEIKNNNQEELIGTSPFEKLMNIILNKPELYPLLEQVPKLLFMQLREELLTADWNIPFFDKSVSFIPYNNRKYKVPNYIEALIVLIDGTLEHEDQTLEHYQAKLNEIHSKATSSPGKHIINDSVYSYKIAVLSRLPDLIQELQQETSPTNSSQSSVSSSHR